MWLYSTGCVGTLENRPFNDAIISFRHFNIVSVCLSALWLVAPYLRFSLYLCPIKKDARFTWVIVHAIAILYVSGISQQDYRAAVRNEKDLKFI